MNFELFLHKTYINNIFYTKYLNEHLCLLVNECPSCSKDHDSNISLNIFYFFKKMLVNFLI